MLSHYRGNVCGDAVAHAATISRWSSIADRDTELEVLFTAYNAVVAEGILKGSERVISEQFGVSLLAAQ